MPLIDIVIPTYNPGPYLRECIASCLGQTQPDCQVSVVDDASMEDVESVVSSFADERLRFTRNPRQLGIGANWNRAVRSSSAPFVTVFHQDDVMEPDNVEQKAQYLQTHADAVMVGCGAHLIDAESRRTGFMGFKDVGQSVEWSGSQFIRERILAKDNHLSCPSVMMRRSAYERAGGFSEALRFALDIDMWVRLASHGTIGYVPQPLIAHRQHARQTSEGFRGLNGLWEEYQVKHSAIACLQNTSEQNRLRQEWREVYLTRVMCRHIELGHPVANTLPSLAALWRISPASLFSRRGRYLVKKAIFRRARSGS